MPARHPATRRPLCHSEAGVQYSTAGKRVKVYRQVEVDGCQAHNTTQGHGSVSGLMIVRSQTKIETGRVIPFESTPNGWNLTVELEAPNHTNNKLQEVMDIMMIEKRLEQTEKIVHMRGLPRAIKNKC